MKAMFKISILLLFVTVSVFGQDGIKFQVEKLSKPKAVLPTTGYDDVYKKLILSDANVSFYSVKKEGIRFPYNIIAKSTAPDSLVCYGYQSFFNGMYQAYADHRPFVISPDMIWLLISQGFARHVSANSELLRRDFVNFDGKLSLLVQTDHDMMNNCSANDWEEIFPKFTQQISAHTGDELINLLSADFSTTTPAEKIASEVTLMEAMEPYFEFVVIRIVCGIPEITLKGTTEDWQKIYDRTKELGKYDLKWWTNELEPILKEFITTSQGNIDKDFWRNMFKYHAQEKYGAPKIIDGWIVKFFPYDKDGKRNNLKELNGSDNLPEEIVKVDLKYIEVLGDSTQMTPLELWAGFIGLKQNPDDFTLTPQIGWMVRKKDIDNNILKYQFRSQADFGISIKVKEIPNAIYELKKINSLEIAYIDSILVPDKLKEIKIGKLKLSGKIDQSGIARISKMFPDTELVINKETINAR